MKILHVLGIYAQGGNSHPRPPTLARIATSLNFGTKQYLNISFQLQGWGKTVVLGMDGPGSQVTLPSLDIIFGKTLTGSLFGGLKPKSDIAVLINRYKDKVIYSILLFI